LESVQCSPTWIKWRLALTGRVVEVDSAVDTEPSTVISTERRQREVQEDGVVGHLSQVHEGVLDEVRLLVTRKALVDEALVHVDARHAEHGCRAAPTDPVPGRFDAALGAKSPTEALQANLDVHECLGKDIGFYRTARSELVRFIKGCFEVDFVAGGYVAQQLGDRDEIRRGHGR
jgi:hypothetical protein